MQKNPTTNKAKLLNVRQPGNMDFSINSRQSKFSTEASIFYLYFDAVGWMTGTNLAGLSAILKIVPVLRYYLVHKTEFNDHYEVNIQCNATEPITYTESKICQNSPHHLIRRKTPKFHNVLHLVQ